MNFEKWLHDYIYKIVGKHYVLMTIMSFFLTVFATWWISETWNINSDFRALLPEDSEAAVAMEEVSQRVGSGGSVFVVIDSPDKEANIKFAEDFSKELNRNRSIAMAHFHNDKTYFEKNALLWIDKADIKTLRERIEKRVLEEKREANPFFVSLKEEKKEDIKYDDIVNKYKKSTQGEYKEYFIAEDGFSLTMVVRFVEASSDLLSTNKLLDQIRATGEKLDPKKYNKDMTFALGGGLVERQGDYDSILGDIRVSALVALFGLFLIIALFFRSGRSIILILLPLVMSVIWTLAIAFTIFGELTIITAFIFAILLGLGIDFAIHLLHAYDIERLSGKKPVDALYDSYNHVGKATVVGAATTFAVFVVLSFAGFRGLSQFGATAAIGVTLAIIAMVTVQPAMILTIQRIKPAKEILHQDRFAAHLSPVYWLTNNFIHNVSKPIAVFAIVLTIFSFWVLPQLQFEEDFYHVGRVILPWERAEAEANRSKNNARYLAEELAEDIINNATAVRKAVDPKTYVQKRVFDNVYQKYSSALGVTYSSVPTILLFDEPSEARRVSAIIKKEMNEGKLPYFDTADSIYSFMPGSQKEQEERVAEAKKLKDFLDKEGTSFLNDEQKKKVDDLRKKLDIKPITVKDLPEWTKHLFKEAGPMALPPLEGEPYAYQYLIYINANVSAMNGPTAREFISSIERIRRDSKAKFKVASPAYVYISMLNEIRYDGAVFLGIAIVLVFFILTISFRSIIRAFIALIPLIFGLFWTIGICAYIGIKLDFFNVIILPSIVGIGIDDGIHLYLRYLRLGRNSVAKALGQVGTAITLTTVTSFLGFGSLGLSHYRGLESMGNLAMVGLIMVYISTVVVMPAMIILAERFNIKAITADHDLEEGLVD